MARYSRVSGIGKIFMGDHLRGVVDKQKQPFVFNWARGRFSANSAGRKLLERVTFPPFDSSHYVLSLAESMAAGRCVRVGDFLHLYVCTAKGTNLPKQAFWRRPPIGIAQDSL